MFCERDMLQPDNPTDAQRYDILKYMLSQYGRERDLPNIIRGLSPPKAITKVAEPGTLKGYKIAVLGAGVAGLSAAYELRKMGATIDLYEAQKDHIGGKCYTYFFDADNFGELGPMRIPVGHECTWHYINLFHLDTSEFLMSIPNNYIYIRKKRVRNDPEGKGVMEEIYPMFLLTERERETPWQQLLVQGLMNPLYSVPPDVRQQILYQLPVYNATMADWFAKDLFDVMLEMGISTGAINMLSNLSFVLNGFPGSSFSESFQENYTGDFEYLYQINEGCYKIPMAFYKALTTDGKGYYSSELLKSLGKVEVYLGKEVKSLHYENDKIQIMYTDVTRKKNEEKTYDYVVCALPFSTSRVVDFTPDLGINREWAMEQAYYQDIQKTLMFFKKRFWLEEPFNMYAGGSITDLPIQSIWYPKDGITDPNAKGVLTASYNLGLNANRIGTMDEERRIATILRQIEEVHDLEKGYLDDLLIDHMNLNYKSDQWYQGMCYYNPRQKTLFGKGMIKGSYDEHLQFAGVHMSSTHGWMQGALKTGMESANRIVEAIVRKK